MISSLLECMVLIGSLLISGILVKRSLHFHTLISHRKHSTLLKILLDSNNPSVKFFTDSFPLSTYRWLLYFCDQFVLLSYTLTFWWILLHQIFCTFIWLCNFFILWVLITFFRMLPVGILVILLPTMIFI